LWYWEVVPVSIYPNFSVILRGLLKVAGTKAAGGSEILMALMVRASLMATHHRV
jgi:hypothetical protein